MFLRRETLLLLVACVTLASGAITLNLDGSPGSYLMYPHWGICLDGSFSFQFKTEEPHALLLYLNKGQHFFFEVKLWKGIVRLRVNVGGGTMILRAGESLNDNKWHTVEVKQERGKTSLKVDKVEHSKQSPGLFQHYEPSPSNDTFLYVGGLPVEYGSTKLRSLALSSVIFEPKFRGSFRNFFYNTCDGELASPMPLESSGILTKNVDVCEKGNPCLNRGRCLATDNGVFCDCAYTDFKGDRCDLKKVPSDATFLGSQYFFYNLSSKGDIMVSNQDQIMLDFRTKQASSLLFYTGNGKDHITVGLLNGIVFVTVNLGSGIYETEIQPGNSHFDDNEWHQLIIRREAKEVTIELDGIYKEHGSASGTFVRLSSSVMYLAGSPHTASLPGSRTKSNFKGCMKNVQYQADSIRFDLIELSRAEHGLLEVSGDVIYDRCQEFMESQPVTFTAPGSYLTLPFWNRTSSKGSMAFQFQTMERGGILMYCNGSNVNKDFFALELVDDYLYLVLDMGSGVQKIQASKHPVADGGSHDVYFEFFENNGFISVDGQKEQFSSAKKSDRFDLQGHLYVGGLDHEINFTHLPKELWALSLGFSFTGCLQDLVLNGDQVDLVGIAKLQNKHDVVESCRKFSSDHCVHQQQEQQCSSFPCNHQGVCVEGWSKFSCDCQATGFVGSVCQTAAATLRFDGTQFVKVTMATEMITQAEDISLRFRTMHPSGLLFLTTTQRGGGMELYLEDGALFLSVNTGSSTKVMFVGHTLNDDHWHTVFIKRRMQAVELAVDEDRSVAGEIPGNSFSLGISRIYIGRIALADNFEVYIPDQVKEMANIDDGLLRQQDQGTSSHHSGFIGSMQSFILNGKHFFEMIHSKKGYNIEITAQFTSDEHIVRDPVTFKSVDAYAVLPRLQAHDKFSVTLQLKTTESDGLILYNGGTGQDFFAMELFQGFLFYVYDMGEGPQRVKANVNQPINDNNWHEVRLLRAETHKQLLRVDDNTPTIDDLANAKNNKFDLSDQLYVGGVSRTMYPSLPKHIYSKHGFVGCLGSLDLNGYLPNLIQESIPIHESIGEGCVGPLNKCNNNSCANHGRCVQHWTSYKCDCDMTSFVGPVCKTESVSYRFGPQPGLITFVYPEGHQPSTNFDSLAFGFQTFRNEAVLLRMDSKSFDDFIQIELVGGHVHVLYNMGTMRHALHDLYHKVNDGLYHVVRFTRAGPNVTLQIDSNVPQVKIPTGHQSYTFNKQTFITVGGKRANGSITQHFEGIISGLVLNSVHIFEMAKHKDPKVQFEGGVSLNAKTSHSKHKNVHRDKDIDEMQATQGHSSLDEGVTDDIIFAGAGSGCQYDEEEDCSAISSGTDEEIITAVIIIKTTTPPPTTTKQIPKCTTPECETSKLRQLPDGQTPTLQSGEGDTIEVDGHSVDGKDSNGYSSQHKIHDGLKNDESTAEPAKTADKAKDNGEKGINLGLILGITGSVLVAVIVLCIALYKLRSRDEGTYKVDETQNFSSLQSKRSAGSSTAASGSETGSSKRGRKKDVKEWYV